MPLVNIGDGGPPVDIPEKWLPDWQTHVRAAIARGAQRRAVASAKVQLRQGLAIPTVALRTGLPRDQVARLAAAIRGNDRDLITVADEQRILEHPVFGDVALTSTYGSPAEAARRNPARRIRVITGDNQRDCDGSCGLPVITIRIRITPIEDR